MGRRGDLSYRTKAAAETSAAFVMPHYDKRKEVNRRSMAKTVTFGIQDLITLNKGIAKMRKTPKTVINRTLSDFRKRAPGWVSAVVANDYNITKREVNELGNMKVRGKSVTNIRIVYKGRMLTPIHFHMTPKTPKQSYSLKAEILRGNKVELGKVKKLTKKQRAKLAKNLTREGTRTSDHSPIMLMRTGTKYIPFQRKSYDRKDVEVIKTVSVPHMVQNEWVAPRISNVIQENLGKRIEHHMKLLEK